MVRGSQPAARTGRPHSVPAASRVEVQADEPARVAARWAEIAELRVTGGAKPSIELDNCTIRFVPCADGRPEGLGGLDIVARDRAAILATAKARGTPVAGNQVHACGMRFNLV